MDDRPITLGYASPGIGDVLRPPTFPAMTVVAPFAAGAAAAVSAFVICDSRDWPNDKSDALGLGLLLAWAQAAGLLIAMKFRTRFAARPQALVTRPLWMSVTTGAVAAPIWFAVVIARSPSWFGGSEATDWFTYLAAILVEGAYFAACAFGLTRRGAVYVEPVAGGE